jgi:predicted amidohydrolase
MASKAKVVKAAVIQAEPEWFNLQATVDKACRLITEAASKGAQIVSFPEAWIPGYPTWIWYANKWTKNVPSLTDD